ncbi:MAG: division/cell wall cluster transcriptional repressor MraZ [Anaerorhabdus sp.]
MFIGEFRHSIDNKNRVIIPSKFREELGESFVVTKGLDGCLTVYTAVQWSALLEQLQRLPSTKRESRLYIRSLTAKATECEFDNQGRIKIPPYLLDEGKINKDCIIVGVADHIEIWNPDTWEGYCKQADESLEDIAEQLTDFLL